MTPSLEGWPTKVKEAPSPHEVRLATLDTNPLFQCLGDKYLDIIRLNILPSNDQHYIMRTFHMIRPTIHTQLKL